ncbi:MAG: hypothetical protein V7L31_21340 [Nostoc sp.]|uniref:hypothetical protein n=1 Tax=Nostoc sp. TaxID=1180 RepID=UPI002FEF0404
MVRASSAVRYKLSPTLLSLGYSCLLNAIATGTLNQVWLRLGKFFEEEVRIKTRLENTHYCCAIAD